MVTMTLTVDASASISTGMNIPDNYVHISQLSTMALASHARELIQLHHVDEVQPLFARLQQQQQRFVIISNGSNTLLPELLDVTVITPTLHGQTVLEEDDQTVRLEVMAGEQWHDLVVSTVTQGWYGLENLALIPSWVGASPVQNIGAYGVQVEDVIESVTAFHIPTLTFKTLSNADCEFAYRDSRFKREVGQWLITSVTFRLHKNPNVNVQYGDVAKLAAQYANQRLGTSLDNPVITPIDTMYAIIQIRQSKIPDTNELPNCGSFFKNPIVDAADAQTLLQRFPTLVHYPVKNQQGQATGKVKLAAGWLIDQAGLKGKGIAPILTHVHQALVLTNHAPQVATQADIERTMTLIQQTVYQQFGVMLEPEPVWIKSDGRIRQTH
jgi:UDP-N-acetylmuramate dehydrogenase